MLRQVVQTSAFDCLGPPGGGGSDRPPDRPGLPPFGVGGAEDRQQANQKRRNKLQNAAVDPLQPFLRDRLRRLPNAPLFSSESQCVTVGIGRTEGDCDEDVAVCGGASTADERRLQFLECSITFIRDQHAEMLSSLHSELDLAKRQIQELQFRLVMAEEEIILRRRRSSFEHNRERERRMKREAEAHEMAAMSYCVPVDRLNVSIPPAAGSAWVELPHTPIPQGIRICCSPIDPQPFTDEQRPVNRQDRNITLAVTTPPRRPPNASLAGQLRRPLVAGGSTSSSSAQKRLLQRPPQKEIPQPQQSPQDRQPQQLKTSTSGSNPTTVTECQAIICRLQAENERQARELHQLNANLRDALRTHQKIGPEAAMASRATVAGHNNGTPERTPCNRQANSKGQR